MARVPVAGAMVTSPTTLPALQALEDQRRKAAEQLPGAAVEGAYTIASGAVKPLVGLIAVDTEAAASTDNLDWLTGEPDVTATGFPGHGVVLLRAAHTDRTVVVRHEQGGSYDISLAFGSTFALDSDRKSIALQLRGTRWYEIDRDYGGDMVARRADLGLTKMAELANPANPGDDGKFVGASGGNISWTSLPPGGDGFLETSLTDPGSARTFASGNPIRFEHVTVGTPDTDGYQFFAPEGSAHCRIQCQTEVKRQNDDASHDYVKIKVEQLVGGPLPQYGGFGRGLPARSVFFRPDTETGRLTAPHVSLASSVMYVSRALRVVVIGKPATSYKVDGHHSFNAWLSIQWM